MPEDPEDAPAIAPTSTEPDTDREQPEHPPTGEAGVERADELARLRARLGFIDPDQATPRVLAGRYELIKKLGFGGMGVVHLAYDHALKSEVALKLVRESFLRDAPTAALKLRREAQQMAKLRGKPHVVTVLDVGTVRGSPYLTMEYVAGTDLRSWLEQPRTKPEILRVYLAAARGLLMAHDEGLVHRDFKPENVLIGEDGTVKVTDFGIAAVASREPDEFTDTQPRSLATTVRGTLPYMAPEQLAGEPADRRSDQFSFCVALWEALAGDLPYVWRGRKSQLEALRRAPAGERKIPGWLRPALRRGLAFERRDRHVDMRTLIFELERGLARPIRRRNTAIAGAAALVLLGGGFVVAEVTREAPPASCEPFVASIDALWAEPQRRALLARADESGQDVSWIDATLDRLRRDWANAAASTCSGEYAPSRDDPRRECLERWLGSFERAVDLLIARGDADTLAHAPDLLAVLLPPGGDYCAIAARPDDPKLAELVETTQLEAVLGAWNRAEAASEAALTRARELAGDAPYSIELAHALAARGELERLRRRFPASAASFAEAERHAMGSNELEALARIRIMWARSLASDYRDSLEPDPTLIPLANEVFARAHPIINASGIDDNAQMRGEWQESRALIELLLGHDDQAAAAYGDATEFFMRIGNPILAARSLHNRGSLHHEYGRMPAAEADLRRALAIYLEQAVPASYPRRLDAEYNLALVLFDLAFEIDDEDRAQALGVESLDLLERVIAHGDPTRRLAALGYACQIALDTEQLERLRGLSHSARAALAAPEPAGPQQLRDLVEAQLALSLINGFGDAEAEARVRALLGRSESLAPELRWALARDWIEFLEREARCAEAQTELAALRGLAGQEEFEAWKIERPGPPCKSPI